MASYYRRVSQRAETLTAAARAAGAPAAVLEDAWRVALAEECLCGTEPGRVARAVVEQQTGGGGDAAAPAPADQVAAGAAVVVQLFDDTVCTLFAEHKRLGVHRRAAVVPMTPGMAGALLAACADLDPLAKQRVLSGVVETVVARAPGVAAARPEFAPPRAWPGEGESPEALNGLEALLRHPEFAEVFVAHPSWIAGRCGADFEAQTLLGPFFAHQVCVWEEDYPQQGGSVSAALSAAGKPAAQQAYARRLAAVLKAGFLVPGAAAHPRLRPGLLQYFARFLRVNFELRKTIPKRKLCSWHGTLLNVLYVLLALVEPIYTRAPLVRKLLLAYPLHDASLLDLPKDEPLAAGGCRSSLDDEAALKELTTPPPADAGCFAFPCEAFYLCSVAVELAAAAFGKHCDDLRNETIPHLHHTVSAIRQFLPGATPPGNTAAALTAARRTLLDYERTFRTPSAFTLSLLNFAEYSAFVYLRAAVGGEVGTDVTMAVTDALPTAAPTAWRLLPEMFLLNLGKLPELLGGEVLTRHLGEAGSSVTQLLTLLFRVMPAKTHVVNPYSRASVAEAAVILLRLGGAPLDAACAAHPGLRAAVIPSIMGSYVDLENLGGSNQFFEKFRYRHHLGTALLRLCKARALRDDLLAQSRDTNDLVSTKFFNMMLNDASYLLSEGLKRVQKVHDYEAAQADPTLWLGMTPDDRRGLEHAHAQANTQLRQHLMLAAQALEVVVLMMQEVPDAFLQPALAEKAAMLLNFFLIELVGTEEQVAALGVKDPAKFEFRHGRLVQLILEGYLALGGAGGHELFEKHVAEDERSYSPERFDEVLSCLIAHTDGLGISETAIGGVAELFNRVGTHHTTLDLDALSLPSSLQDPILACLLENPVQLPDSGEWCERRVIHQHLLNDSTNPFNRAPLSVEELDRHNEQHDVAAEAATRRERALAFVKDYQARRAAEGAVP